MAEEHRAVGRDQSPAPFAGVPLPLILPHPAVRIREELAPGVWQFEDETGQLYLAVKALSWHPTRGGDLGARW